MSKLQSHAYVKLFLCNLMQFNVLTLYEADDDAVIWLECAETAGDKQTSNTVTHRAIANTALHACIVFASCDKKNTNTHLQPHK